MDKVWALYQTDGDSGWYNIRIFLTKNKAEKAQAKLKGTDKSYSQISCLKVENE